MLVTSELSPERCNETAILSSFTPATILGLRKEHRRNRQTSGNSLHQKNLCTRRRPSIQASNQYAPQEEQANLPAKLGNWVHETPEQTGGQEAIVKTLVSGKGFSFLGEIGLETKGFKAAWCGPEEHLEYEDIDVQDTDEGDRNGCEERHFSGV
ncbi:unnamed protein product [Diplocarpon coronariae]